MARLLPLLSLLVLPGATRGGGGGGGAQQVFDVLAFGAVGDGRTLDTAAVRAAAAALLENGGGELRFPGHRTYLTGPFNLSSHTLLTLGDGATIRAHNVSGPDWPLLTVAEIWPWFGGARDVGPGHSDHSLTAYPWGGALHSTPHPRTKRGIQRDGCRGLSELASPPSPFVSIVLVAL